MFRYVSVAQKIYETVQNLCCINFTNLKLNEVMRIQMDTDPAAAPDWQALEAEPDPDPYPTRSGSTTLQ